MADPSEALASLRALSQFLLGDQTPREGLLRVAQLGGSALEGAKTTGVTLLNQGRPKTFAYTTEEALEVDRLQYAEGAGPCLEAYRQKRVIRVDSNRTEERWPEFSRRAAYKGVLSSLSVALVVADRGIGAQPLRPRRARLLPPGRAGRHGLRRAGGRHYGQRPGLLGCS